MNLLVKLVIRGIAVMIAAYLVPGVEVGGFMSALVVAVVLGLLNSLLRPILLFLTLPVNIVTLGLFTFVINTFIIWLAGQIVPGFEITSFVSALLFGIVLSLVNAFMAGLER